MPSPPAPHPKHLKRFRAELKEHDGVRSSWKGHKAFPSGDTSTPHSWHATSTMSTSRARASASAVTGGARACCAKAAGGVLRGAERHAAEDSNAAAVMKLNIAQPTLGGLSCSP